MIEPSKFYKLLEDNDINFFSGVPDSLLKSIFAYITDKAKKENHIIAANEGNALSIGIGYHLASKKIPLIYMQKIASATGYDFVCSTSSKSEIEKNLKKMCKVDGNCFMEIYVDNRYRSDLTRPKESPDENKELFMRFINEY